MTFTSNWNLETNVFWRVQHKHSSLFLCTDIVSVCRTFATCSWPLFGCFINFIDKMPSNKNNWLFSRNLSSHDKPEYRKRLRECDDLIDALVYFLKMNVEKEDVANKVGQSVVLIGLSEILLASIILLTPTIFVIFVSNCINIADLVKKLLISFDIDNALLNCLINWQCCVLDNETVNKYFEAEWVVHLSRFDSEISHLCTIYLMPILVVGVIVVNSSHEIGRMYWKW